jgi:hypothetical protein
MDACVKQELVVPWSAVDEIHVGFIFLLRLYYIYIYIYIYINGYNMVA